MDGNSFSIKGIEQLYNKNPDIFYEMIDNLRGGICLATYNNLKLTPLYVNKGFYAVMGYTPEGFRRYEDNIFQCMYKEDVVSIINKAKSSLETMDPFDALVRAYRPDRSVGYFDIKALPVSLDNIDDLPFLILINDITLNHENEIKIQELIDSQDMLLSNIPCGVCTFLISDSIHIDYYNDAAEAITGYAKDDYQELLNEAGTPEITKLIKELRTVAITNSSIDYSFRFVKPDGSTAFTWLRAIKLTSTPHEFPRIYTIMIDITKEKVVEQKLKIQQERYRILEETSDAVLFEYNKQRDVMTFNFGNMRDGNHSKQVPHYMKDFLVENPLVHPDDLPIFSKAFNEALLKPTKGSLEYLGKIASSTDFEWHRTTYSSVADDYGDVISILGRIQNINNEANERIHLLNQLNFDSLTGLYNKSFSTEKVIQWLEYPYSVKNNALLMIDLDNFKQFNDHFGHAVGDTIIVKISEALKHSFSKNAIISRFGGDEFTIFLKDCTKADIEHYINDFFIRIGAIEETKDLALTASIGIDYEPDAKLSYDEMFNHCDSAMYKAKNFEANSYEFY